MVDKENISLVKEINFPDLYKIRLFSDGIIEIIWDEKIEEVKTQHLKQLKAIIKDFGQGQKMPVYITTFPFMNVSVSARKYAASDEGQEFTLANAVQVDNLGKKIMFNFFLNMNKPGTPTKAFHTRDQAIKWLRQLNDQK